MEFEIKPGKCEAVGFFELADDTFQGKTLICIPYDADPAEWRV